MDEAKVLREAKAARPEGRLLTHRVNFVSLRQEADDYAPRIAAALHVGNVAAMSEMLQWFGEALLRRASWAMATATRKAIEEAANLIKDPDYHQTVKERRRRWRARQLAADADAEERRRNPPKPTLEEVQRDLKWARENVARYVEWGASSAQRVAELENLEAQLTAEIETDETVM